MKQLVFARWGDFVADSRGHETQPQDQADLPSPSSYPEQVAAVMCGRGLLVFDPDFRYLPMIHEYVRQVQATYCCGKCLPGIKGTYLLLLALDTITAGKGTEEDLSVLERTARILTANAKCSVCRSAGELVNDGLTHFRQDFLRALREPPPESNMKYAAAISAPCKTACPCHIDIPDYVEKLQETRYDEALAIIREHMPLPGITGRVCPAPCERACTLTNQGSGTIPIKILKRVAADYELLHAPAPSEPQMELTGPPIAVVGAGPAGLSAAYYLVRLGHPVTMFEALDVLGGMVGVGIPPYRQPQDVLEREIAGIVGPGVTVKQGSRIGRDMSLDQLLAQGFAAVFIGVGAHKSSRLSLEAEDPKIKGVFSGGIDFLRRLNLGRTVTVGDRVAVVGGGNTAIDCARTCLRLGASEVHVLYRRTEREMPADPVEVEDARDEGVIFHFLTQPLKIVSVNGHMTGLRCTRMELGTEDHSKRRRPYPLAGSEFDMEVDTLIPAIGQQVDADFMGPDEPLEMTRSGAVKVHPKTMMTSRAGVFAGGDATSGPLTVVHAVAAGKRAAQSIHDYVTTGRCGRLVEDRLESVLAAVEQDPHVPVTRRPESRTRRAEPPKKLDRRERVATFDEVESGLTQYGSYIESSRCLRCFHLVVVAFHPE